MRRIVVTDEIKHLAETYAKGLENGANLTSKPLENLKVLKDALEKNTTKLYFSAKLHSQNGNKKRYFSATQQRKYAEYVQLIIDTYSEINKLRPWQYCDVI